MGLSLQRTEVIGAEPILLDEMKNHLRLDFPDDDNLVSTLIQAAREHAEIVTGKCLVTSSWTYYLDSFPYNWQHDAAPARSTMTRFIDWWANNQTIRIPQAPLQTITSVQYLPSGGGAYVTMDPSTYTVDTTSNPAVIYPVVNYYWPYAFAIHNAVKISFVSGYADDCPEVIKTAIRMLVAGWYEQRTDSATVPKVVEHLLASYRSQPVGYVR